MRRETQVLQEDLARLVSPALKERLVSLALLVLVATPAPPGPQDLLCRAPKDSKDLLDHLEEQVKYFDLLFAITCTARNCCLVFLSMVCFTQLQ